MRTFDIALKYLKDIDFSKYDAYSDIVKPDMEDIMQQVLLQHKKYVNDKDNTDSNDHYRTMIFEACINHLVDLQQGRASYWNVACEIIESEIDVLKTAYEGYTEGSKYPKVMTDKFLTYCANLNPQPLILRDDSELRINFFMCAYHYIVENA